MFNLAFICCFLLLVSLTVVVVSGSSAEDQHESCSQWAEEGECVNNPDYMWESCKISCQKVDDNRREMQSAIPTSFYDITETDIHGKKLHFDSFRGRIVYIVNVASRQVTLRI